MCTNKCISWGLRCHHGAVRNLRAFLGSTGDFWRISCGRQQVPGTPSVPKKHGLTKRTEELVGQAPPSCLLIWEETGLFPCHALLFSSFCHWTWISGFVYVFMQSWMNVLFSSLYIQPGMLAPAQNLCHCMIQVKSNKLAVWPRASCLPTAPFNLISLKWWWE